MRVQVGTVHWTQEVFTVHLSIGEGRATAIHVLVVSPDGVQCDTDCDLGGLLDAEAVTVKRMVKQPLKVTEPSSDLFTQDTEQEVPSVEWRQVVLEVPWNQLRLGDLIEVPEPVSCAPKPKPKAQVYCIALPQPLASMVARGVINICNLTVGADAIPDDGGMFCICSTTEVVDLANDDLLDTVMLWADEASIDTEAVPDFIRLPRGHVLAVARMRRVVTAQEAATSPVRDIPWGWDRGGVGLEIDPASLVKLKAFAHHSKGCIEPLPEKLLGELRQRWKDARS